MNLEERVASANAAVERAYSAPMPGDRRWLVGITPPSYEDAAYEVSLFVLEGSPPKGFVLVNGNQVLALGSDLRKLRGPWE